MSSIISGAVEWPGDEDRPEDAGAELLPAPSAGIVTVIGGDGDVPEG